VEGAKLSRSSQEEEKVVEGSGGEKEWRGHPGGSSHSSTTSSAGKEGGVSSKGGKGGKGQERTSNSTGSSRSGAGGESKDQKDVDQVDQGSSSGIESVEDGVDVRKVGRKGACAGGSKDQNEKIASMSSSSGGWEGEGAANVAACTGASDESMPSSCKQPGLGGVVAGGCMEELASENRRKGRDGVHTDVEKDAPGVLGPTTLWEIAAQNTAAAVAYAKEVKAGREAADKQGVESREPRPFQFTWPGKLPEDAFAHGFFIKLPEGGMKTPPSPSSYLSAISGGPPRAPHVQVVLELLLLCWPSPQVPYAAVASSPLAALKDVVAVRRWDWLLLLMALLQQTSTEQKQQVMKERGPLLMQLLYQVLLEDTELGGAGESKLLTVSGDVAAAAWHSWFQMMTGGAMKNLLDDEKIPWAASVPMAVTMVLQNLLYESLPESLVDPETAQIGRVLKTPSGKFGTWGNMETLGCRRVGICADMA
jgi:hypothetical protein